MKEIVLPSGHITKIDDEDFALISNHRWYIQKYKNSDILYAKSRINGKYIRMHRFIMNPPDNMVIDHINQDGLDNRKCNLRICTVSENARNKKKTIFKKNKTGIKGVHQFVTKKGAVRFQATLSLGVFDTKEEASATYKNALVKIFGDFYKDK